MPDTEHPASRLRWERRDRLTPPAGFLANAPAPRTLAEAIEERAKNKLHISAKTA